MSKPTPIGRVRPVALPPSSQAYRTAPGRLLTFAGIVPGSAVAGFVTTDGVAAPRSSIERAAA